ncbi:MAG: Rieske 2Fe-2S domain-containing protein [Gammaproteobacteria bacterium]|nr:Rieske 2Fe-2S domain-containing protein [Gammaproteobacteria bacterium]
MKRFRFPFTPYPDGIFAVLFSHELKLKQVLSVIFMNQKLVLFRTETGEVGAVDGFCPHLGADLAFGSVKKDALQCPFHGMRFKTDGTCATKNRDNEIGKYQLKHWGVFEKYGLIFLTHNPTLRDLHLTFPEWNFAEWGKPIQYQFKIKSHPQEILENSVDQLHFFQVHKYLSAKTIEPINIFGHEFIINYRLERKGGIFGEKKKIKLYLNIHAYGLGMSHATISIPQYNMQLKQIVFPTPIDGEFIHIRSLTSVKIIEKIAFLPRGLTPYFLRKQIANFLTRLASRQFLKDFIPDLEIWENKKYVERPEYHSQDGEFEKYRAWARQFYRDDIK